MEPIKTYLLGQADKLTAWIGFAGLVLLTLHLHSFLVLLFIALIALPEAHFSGITKRWTDKLRSK